MKKAMIRYQYRESKILFVGINPHHGSYRRGVPFSNNKSFWYLLSRAGLINESISDLKKDTTLKKIYRDKFNKVYGLGLLNVITRPTRDITELKSGEERRGREHIRGVIKSERPQVVCFIGKIAYQKFLGLKDFSFGWQPDLFSSKIFVMHIPLHGKASVRILELKIIKKAAKL